MEMLYLTRPIGTIGECLQAMTSLQVQWWWWLWHYYYYYYTLTQHFYIVVVEVVVVVVNVVVVIVVVMFVSGTKVIGIHCKDVYKNGMILASLSNGVVTDSSWKCSSTYQAGWSTASFDDSSWGNAFEIGTNVATDPWGSVSDISSKAKFIWTLNYKSWTTRNVDVYCRMKVGKSNLS